MRISRSSERVGPYRNSGQRLFGDARMRKTLALKKMDTDLFGRENHAQGAPCSRNTRGSRSGLEGSQHEEQHRARDDHNEHAVTYPWDPG